MNQRNVAQPPSAVLVVGGAGFLGSHIVDRLLSDGSRVDVVDDLSSGSLANLSSARSSAPEGALRIHTLDVTIPEFGEVVRLRRPEVMYVTSLLTPTTSDADGCTKAYAVAVAVYEAAVQAKVGKVVVTLPAAVLYGEVPAREMPIKEDRERRPVGLAGVTAMAIIELCELYRRNHDIEFTVLALSTVYGTRQRPDNNVVSAFVSAVSTGASPNISGDGKQTRDFLFVDDAADAASRACTKGGGLVLHIGSGQQTSIKDLWALVGGGSAAQTSPKPAHHLQRFALSTSRARLHLGWSSWTSISEGLSQVSPTS
jgi:UDP-glucose 4-epimerase